MFEEFHDRGFLDCISSIFQAVNLEQIILKRQQVLRMAEKWNRFVDFLAETGQRLWQVLPLGPTGYGDSPYQCFSAFAGNPLLISLEKLRQEGVLSAADLEAGPAFPDHEVDYGVVIEFRISLLKKAFQNFKTKASSEDWIEFEAFCRQNASWLQDYALFMAVKESHGGAVWNDWEPAIAARRPAAISQWSEKVGDEIQSRKYWQHQFFKRC